MEAATRPPHPDAGATLELTVDALAHGGAGVARHDGYVVFVQGAIPGDRVRAVLRKRKRAFGEAELEAVLEPSPERIEPVAHHPGAPWQVLPYERQLAVKAEQVADALRRIGKLDGFEEHPIVAADDGGRWRYRNKLELSFGEDDDGELVLGFHPPGRWWEVAPMDDCLLGSERMERARRAVLAFCREQGLSAYDRRASLGLLRNLVIREGRRTGELQLRLVTGDGELDHDALADAVLEGEGDALFWTRTDQLAETTQGGVTERVAGPERLTEELARLRFEVSPPAFFQVNTEMAERLYAIAAAGAALTGYERVFDLYCGIGTIGLSLALRAGEVHGLEQIPEAAKDARRNAYVNGIENARFAAGDVRTALGDLVDSAGRPDVVVVDPPRAGLSAKVTRRLIEAAPKRIVYVSCNPTTLAPNAAQLVEAGYALREVTPVDLFPQTPHVECVAVLDRTATAPPPGTPAPGSTAAKRAAHREGV